MSKSPVWDQVGHAAQGASVVLPHFVLRNRVVASTLSGGIALFWRELSQLRRSNGFKEWKAGESTDPWYVAFHLGDRLLDVAFGAIGGAVLGGIWVLVT